MESKQDNYKYVTCPKRKYVIKTFKKHSNNGDNFNSTTEIYRKVREPRHRHDNNKGKTLEHGVHQEKKAEKEVAKNIDIYQQYKKNRDIILRPRDIYFYDTKHKCYYSSFNRCFAANNYYKYSGTDGNRLLIFLEYTNKTMERLMTELNKTQNTPDLSTIILVINPKKIKEILKANKQKMKKHIKRGYFNYKTRDTSLFFSNVTSNHFDIKIKNHCIGLKISIRKYSGTLLETLTAICNLARCFFPTYEIKMPCVHRRNWHFQNIVQGILLRIFLRNININNLNIMRQLYFVLITDATLNLTTELNLILKKDIYIVYAVNSSQFVQVELSYLHKYILRKSMSFSKWNIISKLSGEPQQVFKAIAYYTKPVSDHRIDKSLRFVESTECCDGDTYTKYSYTDILYGLSQSDITELFSVNQSVGVGTSFIFPTNKIFNQSIQNETKSVSTICDIQDNTSLMSNSKLFLVKLFNDLKMMNYCLSVHRRMHDNIFEAANAATYAEFVDQYCKQFKNKKIYTNMFKYLTQNLIHTFLSYKI